MSKKPKPPFSEVKTVPPAVGSSPVSSKNVTIVIAPNRNLMSQNDRTNEDLCQQNRVPRVSLQFQGAGEGGREGSRLGWRGSRNGVSLVLEL